MYTGHLSLIDTKKDHVTLTTTATKFRNRKCALLDLELNSTHWS